MPLVTTKEMFARAYDGGYAIGAFNVNNMETVQGIVEAAKNQQSPLILQVSKGTRQYTDTIYLKKLVEAAIDDSGLPIALHLDHGDSFEICKSAVDDGFTSVMIDASHLPLQDNIRITSEVVKYAHNHGVVVEGEIGKMINGDESQSYASGESYLTDPDQIQEFVSMTGIDSLSISIGTSRETYKFNGEALLRFDILEEATKRLPKFPFVLHGASSIIPTYVDTINQFGGTLPAVRGVSEEQLHKAATMSVCKININSDLRLAFTAAIRKHLIENPAHFDPRQYLAPARKLIQECVEHKITYVLGSNGKAF